jgi:hypothetical protein
VEHVEDERRSQEGRVDEDVVAEEHLAEERDLGQTGDIELRERGHPGRPHVLDRERGRQAESEDVEHDPGDDLVGSEPDVEQRQDDAREQAGGDSEPEPGIDAAPVGDAQRRREGADQHHALDADVQHPGLLHQRLAVRRPQHRDHQRDAEGEDVGDDHCAASA